MDTMTLHIDGMHCGSCVARVTRALSDLAGVKPEEVRVGSARVTVDPRQVNRDEIVRAISEAGYAVKGTPAGCCSGRGCCSH